VRARRTSASSPDVAAFAAVVTASTSTLGPSIVALACDAPSIGAVGYPDATAGALVWSHEKFASAKPRPADGILASIAIGPRHRAHEF
jgi:hypothetical protein